MKDVLTISTAMSAENNNNITNTIKGISKRLFGFIKQRVASTDDAEDILQDVFYQFAGNTEPIEQAGSWLYKVARNKSYGGSKNEWLEGWEETQRTVCMVYAARHRETR